MNEFQINEKVLYYDSQKFNRAAITKINKATCTVVGEDCQTYKCFYSDVRKIDLNKTSWDSKDSGKPVIGSHQRLGKLEVDKTQIQIIWEDDGEIEEVTSAYLVAGANGEVFYLPQSIPDEDYLEYGDVFYSPSHGYGVLIKLGIDSGFLENPRDGSEIRDDLKALIKIGSLSEYVSFRERKNTPAEMIDYILDEYDRIVESHKGYQDQPASSVQSEVYYCTDKPQQEVYYCTDKHTDFVIEAGTAQITFKDVLASNNEDREIIYLYLTELRLDGGTQQREKTDLNHVRNLEDALEENAELDPIEVIQDEEENYWVVDGFHRVLAYKRQERDCIPCYLSKGTQRDAILKSVSANSDQKTLPRTRADKQKAVKTLLEDKEWSQWSDRELAKIAKVSHTMVAAVRKSMATLPLSEERKFVNKHGTVSSRKVSNEFKDGDYGTKGGAKSWNPEDFGETPRQFDETGQGSIFFDDSIEPPDPDDYPNDEEYEKAHEKFEEKQPPKPTRDDETIAREVTIGLVSNVEILSKDQLLLVKKRVSETLLFKGKRELLTENKRAFINQINGYELAELRGVLEILRCEIKVREQIGEEENANEKALVS